MVRGEADLETTARHLLRHQCGGYVFARIQWRLTVRMEEQEHVPGCSLRAAVDLISLAGGGIHPPRQNFFRPPPPRGGCTPPPGKSDQQRRDRKSTPLDSPHPITTYVLLF